MKVAELREKLGKLKKEEVVKIASEFYKLIPKAKKEDYNVDDLVNNPSAPKKKAASKKTTLSLAELEDLVNTFISHAKGMNYISPNREVPKKERSTWRFKVKRWYKELINTSRNDKDLPKQAQILSDLYELLCESCRYNYFTAYDSFESVGITQIEFYTSVINLQHEAYGKTDMVQKHIELIVNNSLNRYTLYTDLIRTLIDTYESPDLKYKAIDVAKKLIEKNKEIAKPQKRTFIYNARMEEFRRNKRVNNLAELGLICYFKLFEFDNGIQFFQTHHIEKYEEIKLFVLIHLLFAENKPKLIIQELEKAMAKDIKPREKLMKLMAHIKSTGELPQYI